jgi:methyl-accepting chemotaxis protein
MSIRSKLILNVLISTAAIAAVALMSLFGMNFVRERMVFLTQRSTPFQLRTLEVQQNLQKSIDSISRLAASRLRQEFDALTKEVQGNLEATKAAQDSLQALSGDRTVDIHAELGKSAQDMIDVVNKRLQAEQQVEESSKAMSQNLQDVSNKLQHLSSQIMILQNQFTKNFGSSLADVKNASSLAGKIESLKSSLSAVQTGYRGLIETNDRKKQIIQRGRMNATLDKLKDYEKTLGAPKIVADIQQFRQSVEELSAANTAGSPQEKIAPLMKQCDEKMAAALQTLNQEGGIAGERYDASMSRQDVIFEQANMVSGVLSNNNELTSASLALQILISQLYGVSSGEELDTSQSRIREQFKKAGLSHDKMEASLQKMGLSVVKLNVADSLRILKEVSQNLAVVQNTLLGSNGVAARLRYKMEMRAKALRAEQQLQELATRQIQNGQQALSEASSNQGKAITTVNSVINTRLTLILVIGIASIAFGIFFGLFITRSITGPLNRVIAGLTDGANQVSSAAAQVSSSSQQLADSTSEQASSLEETSASLEEMSSMTKQNAEHAHQAKAIMSEAGAIVQKVDHHMQDMADAIGDIIRSSEETGKIIKTIDEIAFQTNLLALNAAVEAARAGEAGAGFAVVAAEVRNLAKRASEAAKNTNVLIENTITAVRKGSALTKATQAAFQENTAISKKISQLVEEIATASEEQSLGITQVNTAVAEMDKVTQSTAANAEESAAASEELNAQAEEMKTFIGDLVNVVGGGTNGKDSRGDGRGLARFMATAKRPQMKESRLFAGIGPGESPA